METIDVKPIDVSIIKEVEKDTQLMTQEASALVIRTQKDFETAGSLRMKIKGKIKELDEKRKSITVPLDIAKKNIMALFNPIIDRLNNGIEIIDQGVIIFSDEQDRKARELQAKADQEARLAREKAEARARELEAQGKTERAQAMQAKADAVIAPVIIPATPKVAGQGIREIWDFEIVESSLIPRQYLIPDDAMIRKIANATKGKLDIPGIKIVSRKIVSGKSS
jgi:hypothetical protein